MAAELKVEVHKNEDEVIKALTLQIERISKRAIVDKELFTVGVSGGSLVNALAKGLPNVVTEWEKWRIFFCDERIVPFDDGESTFGVYKKQLLSNGLPLKESQFYKIDPSLPADKAAADYIKKLESVFGTEKIPQFDCLLLGMGPDGHTCSLFPNHPLLAETSVWVAPITDSPKPPPCRITLTYPVINNSKNCIFAIWGAGKADMVKRILKDKEPLPAAGVKPTHGILYWILDEAAASKMK